MSDRYSEWTEEQAFEATRTTSRESLERELDRLQRENRIFRWFPPGGGKDTTYLIIWAPYAPEPFTPGRAETIDFAMPDICHTFLKGHRIMVHIQSSWFPLVDRNPQTFVDIPKATEADFKKAVERVYLGGEDGSRIRVRLLER